jgi:hypothetical protein
MIFESENDSFLDRHAHLDRLWRRRLREVEVLMAQYLTERRKFAHLLPDDGPPLATEEDFDRERMRLFGDLRTGEESIENVRLFLNMLNIIQGCSENDVT